MPKSCKHLTEIRNVTPLSKRCVQCEKTGDTWVQLRLCRSCGFVGCCNSSKNKHAIEHYHETKHPIIESFEPVEGWKWCYIDELFM